MKKGICILWLTLFLITGCSRQESLPAASSTGTIPVSTASVPETVPSTATTELSTEPPAPEHFLLTFAGDCTLGCAESAFFNGSGYVKTIGEDYRYPFRGTIEYFENDDFSMVNLEGPLVDSGNPVVKKHTFRGPTAFVNILTQNSIEAVTLANNHSLDYGQAGYDSTVATLQEANVTYVEQDSCAVFTTSSGLTIGLYAAAYDHLDVEAICAGITALKETEGVDLVIFAPHWGVENTFRPNEIQKELGYAAIDAGADIVFGTHPHVLQPIEAYNGGIIFYSLGNFSFGGNGDPRDYDTALVQQEVIRDPDGTVRLGQLTIVPCAISTKNYLNDFQPTPYPVDSPGYQRVMEKLNGTYSGGNLPWD